jgi:hypothetical protein
MSLYYVVTAENKCAGKLDTNIWARRNEDERVERWLLLSGTVERDTIKGLLRHQLNFYRGPTGRGARRRLSRWEKNTYQETKIVVKKNKRMKI